MTLTWVICGAGRRVGKTHLAQRLCEVLPNAVYAKQGCSTKKAGKPANFFRTKAELASFLDASRDTYEHIVVESNELAREEQGDIIIFVEGIPGRTDYRDDAALLRSKSHLEVGLSTSIGKWRDVLRGKSIPATLCDAVCGALAEHTRCPSNPGPVACRVEPLRISMNGTPPVRDRCDVVVEELVTIMVEGVGSFPLMCTPCDVEALAVGFAFSEGMITSIGDVVSCSCQPEQQTVGLRLGDPQQAASGRDLIVTSSCGLCTSRNVDKLMDGLVVSNDSLRVRAALLRTVVKQMRARQALFTQTGGTHAAGIFTPDGELIAVGEDIGRHNALDKAIGKCLTQRVSLACRGAVLSGRVSLELVAKAARAGLEMMVAVSAPSSLAIEAAERCNITLCGFVRRDRATVYTHPRRIEGLNEQTG
jgi:FdhD protein